ncbi:uncharacterized protein [Danio rerio]|uniref:Uncharacterized protein n=1 Tax=Danio rerio TaxID=7955 RepID=A0AC58IYF5_DANRE
MEIPQRMFSKTIFRSAQTSPELLVNTKKLDVALCTTTARRFLARLDDDDLLSVQRILQHHSKDDLRKACLEGTLWPFILQDVLTKHKEKCPWKHDNTPCVMCLIQENLGYQHSHLLSGTLLIHREADEASFSRWIHETCTSTILFRNLVYLKAKFGVFVELSGALQPRLRSKQFRNNPTQLKEATTWSLPAIELTACWNKEVVCFTYQQALWILPIAYILLIHNKICDLLSSLLLITASSGVCYESDAYDLSTEFLRAISHLAATHADYFGIARTLEGLLVAETLAMEEKWQNTTLRNSISAELEASGYYYYGGSIESVLEAASTPLRNKLAGLIKIPGHSLIDIEATAAKARERATVSTEVNYYAIQMTRNLSLEQLIKNHIIKHGKWPPVTFEEGAPRILTEAHRLGWDPKAPTLARKFGAVSSDMYVYVTLEKILEMDYLSHYTQYLKDKTLSVMRNSTIAYYIENEARTLDWNETRLLLVHLLHSEEELNIRGYLQQYQHCSDEMEDVLNYLAVKLVPKEKELKVKGRPFGCKTYQDRYRGCVQEENVKHLLDQYYEDQAMTLDNLSLVKRLYSFWHLTSLYKDWKVLCINFDVSGWCGNFRHETVEPLCSDILDTAYGVKNFFRKTQLAYEQGFFYLPYSQGTYHWEGQQGGIEGLNQYTWMLTYIPQMRYALREFRLHYFVMAYGGDYKASLLIPPNQQDIDMADFRRRVVSTVAHAAKTQFGQNMKTLDSYGSEAYISFCKNASVCGIEMHQGV